MKEVLRLSLPLTLWLVSFSAVYGLQALVCAQGWQAEPGPGGIAWGRLILLSAAVGAVLLQGVFLWGLLAAPSSPGLVRRVSIGLGVTALVATVWTLFPVALPLCS
jgi:hypothetical protein